MGEFKHISVYLNELKEKGMLNPKNEVKILKIKDIWGAAFIKSKGVKMVDIIREGKSVYFLFEPKARDVIMDYENGGKISDILYKRSIDDLKSIIYDHEFI